MSKPSPQTPDDTLLPPPEPTDLLSATIRLTHRVEDLTKKVDVAQRQNEILAKQQSRTRIIMIVGFAVILLATLVGWNLFGRVNDNAIQGCENANESRAASLALWTTVLDLSKQSAQTAGRPTDQIDSLAAWVGEVYQPHDCTDLGREYPIPPPPVLTPQ